MTLGTNRRINNLIALPTNIHIDQTPIEHVSNYKYLGIILNNQLTFKEQINMTVGIVAPKVNALFYLKRYVNYKTLLQIYKTTILPLMEYSNIAYPLISKSLNIKKQRLQNRALKIIYSHQTNISLEEMHTNAKLTSLSQRADKQILSMMFKRSLLPDTYKQLSSEGITRLNQKIRFDNPKPNLERFKYFPQYYGSNLWNALDHSTQKSESFALFKSRIPRTPDFTQYPVCNLR